MPKRHGNNALSKIIILIQVANELYHAKPFKMTLLTNPDYVIFPTWKAL